MRTLAASSVVSAELDRVDEVVGTLPDDSSLRSTLTAMMDAVRAGTSVVVSADAELTPAVAAKLVGMSRTHLYKLMDGGELPFTKVGRDRRIATSDLDEFARRRDQSRKALAEQFAHSDRARAAAHERLTK